MVPVSTLLGVTLVAGPAVVVPGDVDPLAGVVVDVVPPVADVDGVPDEAAGAAVPAVSVPVDAVLEAGVPEDAVPEVAVLEVPVVVAVSAGFAVDDVSLAVADPLVVVLVLLDVPVPPDVAASAGLSDACF